jgi:hypothetical protein
VLIPYAAVIIVLLLVPEVCLGSWQYQEVFDKMRRQTTYMASIDSLNKLNRRFPYNGGVTGTLILRESPKFGYDILLSVAKGQFRCSFGGCTVSMKFDEGKVKQFSAVGPSDGSANLLFLRPYGRLHERLRKAKRVIEAEFFQEGLQQLDFDVSGLQWK